jgi:predicted Fe-S protein YdhL (DUF1289 family)
MNAAVWCAASAHARCVPAGTDYLDRALNAQDAMAAIDSPCNKVCIVDKPSGLCVGCGRTLDEIAAWTRFSSAERTRIMRDLPRRLQLLGEPRTRANGN